MHIPRFAIICAASAILASCKSNQGSLTYFSDIDTMAPVEIGDYNIKIEPADELLITVTSAHPEATAMYNLPLSNPATNESLMITSQARQQTFIVDSNGDINYPQLGLLHVEGMTLMQLRDMLTQKISDDVEDPLVRVELVNFVVDVAGEVKEPGRVSVTTTRFSVLDALTAAGDLTTYGMRNNVLVIREENGKRTSTRLDLNKAETLNSPYFYVKQNDYIYVEPTPVRKDNADYNQNNSFKLSVVSTIVSGCSVIASLIIALTR